MRTESFVLKVPRQMGAAPPLTIRSEYALMVSELREDAKDFRLNISETSYNDLTILALTTEKLDAAFDVLETREARSRLKQQVCRMVAGEEQGLDASEEVRWVVQCFCDMANRRGLRATFSRAARAIFECGEAKRHCLDRRDFVNLVLKESDLLIGFLMHILGPQPQAFHRFALALQRSTNLLDDFTDMAADHREGSQDLRPSLGLYGSVLLAALRSATSAFLAYPRKLRLLVLATTYISWLGRASGLANGTAHLEVEVETVPVPSGREQRLELFEGSQNRAAPEECLA